MLTRIPSVLAQRQSHVGPKAVTRVRHRMPKEQRLRSAGPEALCGRLALDDVFLEDLNRLRIEVAVGVGVVAE